MSTVRVLLASAAVTVALAGCGTGDAADPAAPGPATAAKPAAAAPGVTAGRTGDATTQDSGSQLERLATQKRITPRAARPTPRAG